MEIAVAYSNYFFITVRIRTNHSNSILVHFDGLLFHVLQKLANQWLRNYHINISFSNIFSLDSFISQHQSLDALWGGLHHTLTAYKSIWEKLCSGHFSVTDTVLRSRWCPLERGFTLDKYILYSMHIIKTKADELVNINKSRI